ncbi:MAG: hypothetical protein ABIQ35_04520, partial [Verrucomicrobiota bacterium]
MKIKLFASAVVCSVSLIIGQNAQAIPTSIAGIISFSGTATTDTGSFLTATRFTQFDQVVVGTP